MEPGFTAIPLAIIGGAIRVSTPFLFVSLGECLTEKSGRINLGHEGSLIMGAMSGYGISLATGSPWIGIIGAGVIGSVFGFFHGWICGKKGVNDIAMGIAMMMLGTGLSFFFGKSLIKPTAPRLTDFSLAGFTGIPQVEQAFKLNVLFLIGIMLAFFLNYALKHTKWGIILRITGESGDAGIALGYPVNTIRTLATAAGTFMSGIAGAYLSLYYPGSWNEGLSSGQGLMAVALVIFAKWNPVKCLTASLIFGGAGAIGPSLQGVGITDGYYLFNAMPYILTLFFIILGNSNKANDAPAELSIAR